METGERLNAESFARYRKSGGMVIAHSIPEDVVKSTLADSIVIIASDGMLSGGKGHPRRTGSFARVLGKYVREENVISLEEAISKMTSFPATRFGLHGKGLIKPGMDADLVLFNQDTVIDGADFEDPIKPPRGVEYVLVNGKVAMVDNEFKDVREGRVLRRR